MQDWLAISTWSANRNNESEFRSSIYHQIGALAPPQPPVGYFIEIFVIMQAANAQDSEDNTIDTSDYSKKEY